jgi:DNA-binding NtrC family response regulator
VRTVNKRLDSFLFLRLSLFSTLPLCKNRQFSKSPCLAFAARYTQNMILLVEDEAIVRHSFAQLLRSQGHEVMEAANGTEAVALLNKWRVDLVISDLVVPNLNGLNLISLIRARWPRMPIVLISGYLSQDAGNIILDGLADFLQKPIRPSALVATVRRLLPRP